jgi:cytochrome c-type biogenesis protein CcmH
MILFWLLAGLFVIAIMFQVLRPLWFGQKATSDERIPLAVYRERLRRLERDVAAGRLDPKEAGLVREQLGQELLEQVEDADPPAAPTRHRPMALFVSALVATLAIAIYFSLGNPDAVTPTEHTTPDEVTLQAPTDGTQAPSLQDAVAGLETRLQQDPENVEDWLLLGRSYAAMDRWDDAAAAIKKALDLAPERADITVDYAEALARVQGARLEGEPQRLLKHALDLDPVNAKAAWLLGMAWYQQEAFSEAADLWEGLLAGIPADNPARESLANQIADARRQAAEVPGGESPEDTAQAQVAAQPPVPAPTTASTGASITVQVSLAPDLASRVNGTETLFVFARAAGGPPMPLAVQRLGTRRFPVTVTLDESMAMMPNMSLGSFPEVVVGARISQAGNVQAQPGDLEALSDPLPADTDQPVMLVIDHVIQ